LLPKKVSGQIQVAFNSVLFRAAVKAEGSNVQNSRDSRENTQMIITFILIALQDPQFSSQGPQRLEVLERHGVPPVCFSTCRKINPVADFGVHLIITFVPPR